MTFGPPTSTLPTQHTLPTRCVPYHPLPPFSSSSSPFSSSSFSSFVTQHLNVDGDDNVSQGEACHHSGRVVFPCRRGHVEGLQARAAPAIECATGIGVGPYRVLRVERRTYAQMSRPLRRAPSTKMKPQLVTVLQKASLGSECFQHGDRECTRALFLLPLSFVFSGSFLLFLLFFLLLPSNVSV